MIINLVTICEQTVGIEKNMLTPPDESLRDLDNAYVELKILKRKREDLVFEKQSSLIQS